MRRFAAIDFFGTFQPARFVDFAGHRARRLDLGLQVVRADGSCVSVVIEGEPDLLDAFEMACSLGPVDCVVHHMARTDAGRRADLDYRSSEARGTNAA